MVLEKATIGLETIENVDAKTPIIGSDILKILLNTDTINIVPVKVKNG